MDVDYRGRCWIAYLVAFVGAAFWPLFAALTAVEQHTRLGFLSPSNRLLWLPVAIGMLACSVLGPLISPLSRREKLVFAVVSIAAYFIGYFVAVAIGISFLHWDD